jgi:hypothetical protein
VSKFRSKRERISMHPVLTGDTRRGYVRLQGCTSGQHSEQPEGCERSKGRLETHLVSILSKTDRA